MDPIENERTTAQELVALAQKQGINLEAVRADSLFQIEGRWIFLWRKLGVLPASGPRDEIEGTLHYNMQGRAKSLPASSTISTAAFRGIWSESGVVTNLDEACALVKAWILDAAEIDALPNRSVRQHGIG